MSEPMNDSSLWPEHRAQDRETPQAPQSGSDTLYAGHDLVALLKLQAQLIDRMLSIILEETHVRH